MQPWCAHCTLHIAHCTFYKRDEYDWMHPRWTHIAKKRSIFLFFTIQYLSSSPSHHTLSSSMLPNHTIRNMVWYKTKLKLLFNFRKRKNDQKKSKTFGKKKNENFLWPTGEKRKKKQSKKKQFMIKTYLTLFRNFFRPCVYFRASGPKLAHVLMWKKFSRRTTNADNQHRHIPSTSHTFTASLWVNAGAGAGTGWDVDCVACSLQIKKWNENLFWSSISFTIPAKRQLKQISLGTFWRFFFSLLSIS